MKNNLLDSFLSWIEKRGGARMIYRPEYPGAEPSPYLERYYIIKSPFCELMIHRFHQGDRGDIHDHPWYSFGWILRHGYREHVKNTDGTVSVFERRRGNFGARNANAFHKVELRPGEAGKVLTLFGTGKRTRNWGFQTSNGWIDWETYSNKESNLIKNSEDQNYHYKGWLFPKRVVVQ